MEQRPLSPAERIARLRRAVAEGRGVLTGDLVALLDRMEQLERRGSAAPRSPRRKAERNAAIAAIAASACPDLPPRQAARRLLRLTPAEVEHLPAPARLLLQRLAAEGGLPTSDRQVADIIREIRGRNEQEI